MSRSPSQPPPVRAQSAASAVVTAVDPSGFPEIRAFALVNDPAVKAREVNVETFKGVVQLSGFVSSQAAMDQAVRITRGIEGVSSVRNDMRIK